MFRSSMPVFFRGFRTESQKTRTAKAKRADSGCRAGVFGVGLGCFPQADFYKPGLIETPLQKLPEDLDHVFHCGIDLGELLGLLVEVFVIESLDDKLIHKSIDAIEIGDLPCFNIRGPFQRQFECVVMAMALGVMAFPEYLKVLGLVPVGV